MHPADIKANLAKQGLNLADIARELDVSRTLVSLVVHSRARSRRVEERVATRIHQPLTDVWPDWYADDGAAA